MNSSYRIAIADDEPDMRKFLCRALTHEGHRVVVTAENGIQLIHECREKKPDLVITDIRMPDVDGLEALHQICKQNTVPAIIVSGVTHPEALLRAAQELVFAFLVKPIKMADLSPAIRMSMQRYRELKTLKSELQLLR